MIRKILATLCTVVSASSTFAVPYVDVQSPNAWVSAFSPYNGVFNLVSPGSSTNVDLTAWGAGVVSDVGNYQTGTDLVSATASFFFADDNDRAIEKVNVFIGLFDGSFNTLLQSQSLTTITFGASTISLAILETFGGINYSVSSSGGDFKLSHAVLTATPATVRGVPDGGTTAILLGLGLLSLVAIRRKLG